MQTIIAVIGIKILKQLAVKFPRKSPSGSHKNTCLLVDLCATTSKMEAFCRTLFSSVMHEILMPKLSRIGLVHFRPINPHQELRLKLNSQL